MKKLICERDIQILARQGEKCVCVDQNTLITPAARDAAAKYKMEITTCEKPSACAETAEKAEKSAVSASVSKNCTDFAEKQKAGAVSAKKAPDKMRLQGKGVAKEDEGCIDSELLLQLIMKAVG